MIDNTDLLSSAPNVAYEKFFAKFKEIENLPVEEWKTTHIIAYFCKIYKSIYNTDYKFKFNSTAPSKSYEVFIIKKISQIISSDPKILKEYIDWVFNERLKSARRKLTSIAFMSADDLMCYYKTNVYKPNIPVVIDRTTKLPECYLEELAICNIPIVTYGDLILAVKNMKSMPNEFIQAYNELKKLGLNLDELSNII